MSDLDKPINAMNPAEVQREMFRHINVTKQLINASECGDLDNVKQLIENGADIHAENDWALRFSADNGHLNVVKYLVENGANIHTQDDHALCWSAGYGYLDVVKYLVENGANIHAQNDHALCWSAENGHLKVVRLLLENGADIHADDDYALCSSAYRDHLEVVRLLLENGAKQSELFEIWDKSKIMKEFFEIENCDPKQRHTNELCNDSFKLPKSGD